VGSGQLDAGRFLTHRFALGDFMEAYDTQTVPAGAVRP
jgi:hypothetical protein